MGPLLLRPNYISPVWSGPRINEARGISGDVLYGESFDVSVHDGLVNVVEGGPHDGTPLDELVRGFGREIMGDLAGEDGIIQTLVMDAAENLSVQVHPDEAYARAHEQAGAYPFQQGHDHKADDRGKRDDRQGGQIVAGEHLVVDLQHIDGEGELQDIDEQAEKEGVAKKASAGDQECVHGVSCLAGRHGEERETPVQVERWRIYKQQPGLVQTMDAKKDPKALPSVKKRLC